MPRVLVAFLVAALLIGVIVAPVGALDRRASAAPWAFVRLENVISATELGVAAPGALTWDASSKALVVEDRASGRAVLLEPQGRRVGSTSRDITGNLAARHPVTRHLFVLDAGAGVLRELDWFGGIVSRRNLGQFRLTGVESIAFAPSADPTDDADATSLFLTASSGAEDGDRTEAGIYEVSLTEPVLAASLATTPENEASRVQTIRTSDWDPASPDPSGVGYSDELDQLIVGDGEVDETTGAGFHDVNVWLSTRTGVAEGAINGIEADPKNNEPVGVAFDNVRGELYVSKDGSSSRVWVYQLNPDDSFTQVRAFLVNEFVADAEGLAFGGGALFVADGSGKEVWRFGPGGDNIVNGTEERSHFDTNSLGLSDPEGIGFHSDTGNLWVSSRRENEGILEVTQTGTPVSITHYDVLPVNPGGLEVAPSSADLGVMSLWIVDRGIDNNDDPNENDGRMYEYSIDAAPPPPPPPPPGSNLISNGGFEEATGGSPDDWTEDSRFTQSNAVVRNGASAGRHQASNNSGYKITQDVPIAGGGDYAFSGWVNAPSTTDDFRIVLKVQWRAGKSNISTDVIGRVKDPTGDWSELSDVVSAPASATTARVMMVVSSLNTTIYVDDFSLASS